MNNSLDPSLNSSTSEIVFIDAGVDNYQELIPHHISAEIVILDPSRDGVEQITQSLTQYDRLESIHLISHGREGAIALGASELNSANLNSYKDSLQSWSAALTDSADILLYGCNVAAGIAGVNFIDRLGQLTTADIAASNNLTGSPELQGDWELEITTGQIETQMAIANSTQNAYSSVLVTYNGSQYQLTSPSLSWTEAQAEAESLGGNLVIVNNAAEQAWLGQTFGNTEQFWIGLSDRNSEGDFEWVDGSQSSYQNWATGEPNDYKYEGAYSQGEDYVLMNSNSLGQWNDVPDSYAGSFQGIIEIDYNPGVVGLETSSYQVNELEGTVELSVLRTQGTDGRTSIDYTTVDVTTTAGEDYQAQSGTLIFEPGESRKTISIPILDDDLVEGTEEFSLKIDNIVGDATLLVPRTALVTIVDDEAGLEPIINYENFTDSSQLTFNGDAIEQNDALRLTSLANRQQGSVFFDRPLAIDADTSFSTQFQFQLSGGTNGADGFTFMLQNDSQALNALGRYGANLGYGGIAQSLAIEFDTYRNSRYDRNRNHISVLRDGDVIQTLANKHAPFDLNSGAALNAWVDYDGDRNLLEVYLADSEIRPDAPLISLELNLGDVLGDRAFVGFSGGTGGRFNNQDILSWQLTTDSELLSPPASAVDLNSETIISGLTQPTAIEWTPNGNIMLVAEKQGVIKVFQNDTLLDTPFIDLSERVNGVRDRGLLDIAIHPDFYNGSPYIYALYTYDPPEVNQNTGLAGADGKGNRAGRLTRITADANTNFTTAIPGSEVVILGKNSTWSNFNAFVNSTTNSEEAPAGILPNGTNLQDFLAADSESHTVGSLEFGPDGALYISNGDGASYNQIDPRAVRVQDIDNLSGKILRIDPITGEGLADNPFYNGDKNANRSKVYQYGLRNPFRISIDPLDGQVYVGDVGWITWEEINASEPGANFGWPFYEGAKGFSRRTRKYRDLPEAQAFYESGESVTAPFLGLNHNGFGVNAIVMGDVYRGNAFPEEYQGDLFFNDLGGGTVYNVSLDEEGKVSSIDAFATGTEIVVQISQAPDGSLYYVDLDDGLVGRWFFD